MSLFTVSVRELHARTGHYVRQAAGGRVVVTDNGRPVAEIKAFAPAADGPFFARRALLPSYKKAARAGVFRRQTKQRDVTDLISDERDAGSP